MAAPTRIPSRSPRTTSRARAPPSPRTPRAHGRRSPAARSPARRTPPAADNAALRGTSCRSCSRSRLEVVRVLREVLTAVVGHEHEVFEPATAPAAAVEAGFERDDVAREQLLAGASEP